MSEIENKPKRRRVVKGGEGLLATSNQTKMKGKARVAEVVSTPLFNTPTVEKPVTNEAIPENKSVTEDYVQFANPLPVTEKPKQTRTRQSKKSKETEKKNLNSLAIPPPSTWEVVFRYEKLHNIRGNRSHSSDRNQHERPHCQGHCGRN